MKIELPQVIEAFFHAHNTGQTDGFDELFTADATVTDEAHEYRGAAIKAWIDGTIAKYKPVADVSYKFTLKSDKIAALAIGA